jgi:hypothetical protein
MSPKTINAIFSRLGFDESTSRSCRSFGLFPTKEPPVDVTVALGLKAEEQYVITKSILCF